MGFARSFSTGRRRGGILAPGASLNRAGEDGKGIKSRWYPETIVKRLDEIGKHADRIGFCETEGTQLLKSLLDRSTTDTVAFVDPPYTARRKRGDRRLYAQNEVDHPALFEILGRSGAEFLMTYDYAPPIVELTEKHRFNVVQVTMKNTHHAKVPELVITSRPVFENGDS